MLGIDVKKNKRRVNNFMAIGGDYHSITVLPERESPSPLGMG
ncbi:MULTISPECIES: hypothetical protein [Bacillus cereus group]|uniref:Uncharacterized protein n=1 Tax=Bacillus cereus TaxID=1396 RepID=A0A0G8F0Z6_BACCE|nr:MULTISPECIES: hypothetical protein [Bacillus cereus group]KLA29432.1 hypothetical protein B4077_3492 [Bacillus cereus]MCU5577597.1 hypothetical protein [Bacillus wiedmannii]WMS85288.1 hypothetical protein RE438_28440 [Bacillus wiedmannii]